MARESHDADDRALRGPLAGSDCGECGPAGSGTQKSRVLFFVCARDGSVVAQTLARLRKRPPDPRVLVTVSVPESLSLAQELAREDFSGEGDRVVVVIDFDTMGQDAGESAKLRAVLDSAASLARAYPVIAFFATHQGAAHELAFKRAVISGGYALGRFETCQIGTGECALRLVRGKLASECQPQG